MTPDDSPIDLDTPATWPTATRLWAADLADRLADSTEFVGDLEISLEQEDEFRSTFGTRTLIAYHNTRLLPHESESILAGGLRLLDQRLVRERIANAIACGALRGPARRHAETGNVYAIGNERHRSDQICFVVGRTIFDEDPHGCEPLLRHWGGEAIRGGPCDVPALTALGAPSIVVAKLNLAGRHNRQRTYPALGKLFVGAVLGLEGLSADVFYHEPVAARDVIAIWQPGNPEYDRHPELPR